MLLGRFKNNMLVVSVSQIQAITFYFLLQAYHTDSKTSLAYNVFPSSIKCVS